MSRAVQTPSALTPWSVLLHASDAPVTAPSIPMRALVERSTDVAFALDPEYRVTFASPSLKEVLGYDPADVLGVTAWDLFEVESLEPPEAELRRRLAVPGGVTELLGCVHAADGPLRWVEVRVRNLIDDESVRGYVANLRDVTARRAAEEAIEFQAQLLEAVGQPVAVTDLDGLVIFWNRCATATFGWTSDEVLGRDITEVTGTLEAGDGVEPVSIEEDGRAVWTREFALRRKDGTTFPAIVSNSPVSDASGAVVAVVQVTTDISEQKSREAVQGRLSSIVTSSRDAIIGLDLDGVITTWNAGAAALFDIPGGRAVGTSISSLVSYGFAADVDLAVDAVARGARVDHIDGIIDVPAGGRPIELEITVSAVRDGAGQVVGASLIARDVTEPNHLRRKAEDDSRRLEVAQRQAHLGSFEVDVTTGQTSWSEELTRILGYPLGTAPSLAAYADRVHPDDDHALVTWADQAKAQPGTSVTTHRIVRPDGQVRWVTITTVAHARDPIVTGTVIDVTETAELQQRLLVQATHDPSTGLPNRRLLRERVGDALARPNIEVTVLVAGIDDFKLVNDSYGHAKGDQAIAWLAHELETVVHPGDTLGRFSGDQFAVICPHCADPADSLALAEQVGEVARRPADLHGIELNLHLSIGVATTHQRPLVHQELLTEAETAMFAAKEAGKHRVQLYDDALRGDSWEGLRIESALRTALAAGTVQVHYQPVVNLRSGTIAGGEALVRLADPDGDGWLDAAGLVAVAERTGLVSELGELVLRTACQEAVRWKQIRPETPTVVSVNISAAQLLDSRIERVVHETLVETGLEPGLLCLEISEGALVKDLRLSAEKLADLRRLGIRLAADEFGTGYSNLAHLKRLPIDAIKAARSYVSGIDNDADDNAIASAVMRLGGSLGLEVVAQGVERPEQADELSRLGCTFAQGYLYSRPLEAAGFRQLLVAGPLRPVVGGHAEGEGERTGPLPREAGDALRTIAHEIRNPLTVVTGYAELLATTAEADADTKETASIIGRAGQRIEGILRYLEDVSAVEDGTVRLQVGPVDVGALVEQVVSDSRRIRPDRPISLTVVDEVTADLDELQVTQCLVNLVVNADKFSPAGEPIEVTVRSQGRTCSIEVSDRGPGIPLASVGTIFRKYSRLDRTTSGSGLGLFLARGIALAHGGDITYHPRQPGPGSTMQITLPTRPTS